MIRGHNMRVFLIMVVVLIAANYCVAQESTAERLRRVEESLQVKDFRKEIDILRQAQRELKDILETDPSTGFKPQVEANLDRVNEKLGYHDLQIARFYMSNTHGHSLIGARSRLQNITQNYPKFSMMDEVLFRLSVVSTDSAEEKEATQYIWKLICNYPNSEYVRPAFDKLNQIGVSSWEGCEKYKR